MSLLEPEPERQPAARSRSLVIATGVVGVGVLVLVLAGVLWVRHRRATPAEGPRPVARAVEPVPAQKEAKSKIALPPAPMPATARQPALGTLHIESDVPGASVFLDREYVGTAPLTLQRVPPGTHQLNVSAPGHDGYAESIEVDPGERDVVVRFNEVRLDASIDVVHKHGFGSCRGRLFATPAGIRYETAHARDAFSVPLADVIQFDVDYPKKNLRIKLRTGKSYDFTDPDGNADRLFVFHRDVQKARERLASAGAPSG
ncbi:MAG: PEGA domain-containing protein [Acidobacteriota bacterium]